MLKKIDWFVDFVFGVFGAAIFTTFLFLSFMGKPACLQLYDYTFGICREFYAQKESLNVDQSVLEKLNKKILEDHLDNSINDDHTITTTTEE